MHPLRILHLVTPLTMCGYQKPSAVHAAAAGGNPDDKKLVNRKQSQSLVISRNKPVEMSVCLPQAA